MSSFPARYFFRRKEAIEIPWNDHPQFLSIDRIMNRADAYRGSYGSLRYPTYGCTNCPRSRFHILHKFNRIACMTHSRLLVCDTFNSYDWFAYLPALVELRKNALFSDSPRNYWSTCLNKLETSYNFASCGGRFTLIRYPITWPHHRKSENPRII